MEEITTIISIKNGKLEAETPEFYIKTTGKTFDEVKKRTIEAISEYRRLLRETKQRIPEKLSSIHRNVFLMKDCMVGGNSELKNDSHEHNIKFKAKIATTPVLERGITKDSKR